MLATTYEQEEEFLTNELRFFATKILNGELLNVCLVFSTEACFNEVKLKLSLLSKLEGEFYTAS